MNTRKWSSATTIWSWAERWYIPKIGQGDWDAGAFFFYRSWLFFTPSAFSLQKTAKILILDPQIRFGSSGWRFFGRKSTRELIRDLRMQGWPSPLPATFPNGTSKVGNENFTAKIHCNSLQFTTKIFQPFCTGEMGATRWQHGPANGEFRKAGPSPDRYCRVCSTGQVPNSLWGSDSVLRDYKIPMKIPDLGSRHGRARCSCKTSHLVPELFEWQKCQAGIGGQQKNGLWWRLPPCNLPVEHREKDRISRRMIHWNSLQFTAIHYNSLQKSLTFSHE